MFKKRTLAMFLTAAMMLAQAAIFVQAEGDWNVVDEPPIPYEEEIENAPDEGILQLETNEGSYDVENVQTVTESEELTASLEEELQNEEAAVMEETSRSAERYIVKYKAGGKKDREKLKKAASTAFGRGRAEKKARESERLEKFNMLDEEKLSRLKIRENGQLANQTYVLNTADVNIDELLPEREEYEVVTLGKSVEAEIFVEEVSKEMGKYIEYIQPDYLMNLSDTENENMIELEIDGNSEKAVNNKGIDEQKQEEKTADDSVAEPTEPHEKSTEEPVKDGNREPENVDEDKNIDKDEDKDKDKEKEVEQITPQPGKDLGDRLYDKEKDLELAWEISRGEGVNIAVIDTGIDVTHPDLAGHIIDGWDFVHETSQVYNAELGLEQAHGTHIAGILAGTAPEAKIMPLKVFENGQAYTSDIIRAIEYAIENGANIINCSFGSTDNNRALREAMESSGLFFVCAAGNSRGDLEDSPVYPAAFNMSNTISVGALNQDLGMTYFSNYGEGVDISAWGRDVYSCFPNGEYGAMNGTSMSAAYVTGAAALAAGAKNGINLKEILKNTSDKLSCLDGKAAGGNKLSFYGAVTGEPVSKEVVEVYPEDDFDVNGYERTPDENWELFNSLITTQVDAGGNNTAYVKEDGSVWMTGDNTYGQLGNGNYESTSVPTKVIGLYNITQVAVGESHCLALNDIGRVYIWGLSYANPFGGNYKITIPTLVSLPDKVEFVEAGSQTSFAIAKGGHKVYAWGLNSYGQLGDGTRVSRSGIYEIEWYNLKSVSSYSENTFFLLEDGSLYGCGSNNHGILPSNGTVLAPILLLGEVVDVSIGYNHVVVVKKDGSAYAWGTNSWGQSGAGSQYVEIDFSEPNHITDSAVWVKAGKEHTIVLLEDGMVLTWGRNYYGQIGNGTRNNQYTPYTVLGISGASMIAAGDNHTIAANQNGVLWSWGGNICGQLGNGSTSNVHSPGALINRKAIPQTISSGIGHTIMVNKDGTVFAWGDNTYGQLGNGATVSSDRPVTVEGLADIVEVTTGDEFSLALDSKGNVYSWGRGAWGMLGTGYGPDSNVPVKIEGLSDIVKISANNYHSLALNSRGEVYAWGVNGNGQLGIDSTATSVGRPTLLNLGTIIDISAGSFYSLAVNAHGDLYAWGINNYYKLGIPEWGTTKYTPTKTGITGVVKVYSGMSHSVAINSDARVCTWGSNTYGQLGVTLTVENTSVPQELTLSNIVDISTKDDHTVAIDEHGRAYSWGRNDCGQLGRKTVDKENFAPTEINNVNFSSIAVAQYTSYGLGRDNNVYKWGSVTGQAPTSYFEKIPYLNKIVDISARRNTVAAVDSKGQVLTWGDGSYWDLGHNSTEHEFYPRVVEGISGAVKVAREKHYTYVLDRIGNIWSMGKNYKTPRIIVQGSDYKDISARESGWYALSKNGTVWTSAGQIAGLDNVSHLECGTDFTVALSGNTIYTWGGNDFGQLGDGTNTSRETPQAIAGSYTKVYTNSSHVLAIGTDGRLYSWGRNSVNQLGLNDSSKTNRNTPTLVSLLTKKVVAAGTGNATSMATLEDGTVWTWGEGREGQFGNGLSQSSWHPIINQNINDLRMISGGADFMTAVDKLGNLYTSGGNAFGQRGLIYYKPVLVDMNPPDEEEKGEEVSKTISVVNGEEYIVVLNSKNISDFNSVEFVFKYDTAKFDLVDSAAHIYGKNITVGQVVDSDITITYLGTGSIMFTKYQDMKFGKTYSGFVNSVKLKAKTSGETEIIFGTN